MERQKILTLAIFILLGIIFLKTTYDLRVNEASSKESIIVKVDTNNNKETLSAPPPPPPPIEIDLQTIINENIEVFKIMGNKYGTDKISIHNYQYLYGTHIGKFRHKEINFLEIGLGCGHGPGRSLSLWQEYMPKAHVYIMEYSRAINAT